MSVLKGICKGEEQLEQDHKSLQKWEEFETFTTGRSKAEGK